MSARAPDTDPLSGRSNAVRATFAIAAVALAAVLVVWVMDAAGRSGSDVAAHLSHHAIALGAVAFISIGLQTWLSALKWQKLHERAVMPGDHPGGVATFALYTALATLVVQILPAPIAVTVVRGLATKLELRGSFFRGAAIGVYDQIFDVAILAIAAVACAAFFLGGLPPSLALAMTLLILAAIGSFAHPLFAVAKPFQAVRRLIPKIGSLTRRIDDSLRYAHQAGLDSPDMAGALTRLSIVRYLAVGMRSVAAILLIAPLPWTQAAWGFGIVQVSSLVALTPGNIGITEWGWQGIGQILGEGSGRFVVAILAMRIVMVPATVVVILVSWTATKVMQRN